MIVVELFSVFKVLADYIMLDEIYHMNIALGNKKFRKFSSISEINKIDGELHD